jgi:hypothetical protein
VLALFRLVTFKREGLYHCAIEELEVEMVVKLEVNIDGNLVVVELGCLIDKTWPYGEPCLVRSSDLGLLEHLLCHELPKAKGRHIVTSISRVIK